MLKQYNADWYRLRKSASFRNTLIGMVALVIFLACLMRFTEPLLASDLNGLSVKINGQEINEMDKLEIEQARAEMGELVPDDTTQFTAQVFGSNIIPFFLLPFIVTIFTADFSFNTYRNTLSYESDRRKIYLAKLSLSAVSCLLLVLVELIVSWLVGGIVFGFGGFSIQYMGEMLISALLLLPSQLAVMCFGHCIAAFTKKTSATLMAFIITLVAVSLIVEVLSISSMFSWLKLFNWNTLGAQLLNYSEMPTKDVFIVIIGGLFIAIVSTLAGISRYQKSDMS